MSNTHAQWHLAFALVIAATVITHAEAVEILRLPAVDPIEGQVRFVPQDGQSAADRQADGTRHTVILRLPLTDNAAQEQKAAPVALADAVESLAQEEDAAKPVVAPIEVAAAEPETTERAASEELSTETAETPTVVAADATPPLATLAVDETVQLVDPSDRGPVVSGPLGWIRPRNQTATAKPAAAGKIASVLRGAVNAVAVGTQSQAESVKRADFAQPYEAPASAIAVQATAPIETPAAKPAAPAAVAPVTRPVPTPQGVTLSELATAPAPVAPAAVCDSGCGGSCNGGCSAASGGQYNGGCSGSGCNGRCGGACRGGAGKVGGRCGCFRSALGLHCSCLEKLHAEYKGCPGVGCTPPLGAHVEATLAAQIGAGRTARMVLYDYDFHDGVDNDPSTLTSRGIHQLEKISRWVVEPGPYGGVTSPLVIEETPANPQLAEQRREAVIAEMARLGLPLGPDQVVVGRPRAGHLRGEEAILVDENMLLHTRDLGNLPDRGTGTAGFGFGAGGFTGGGSN